MAQVPKENLPKAFGGTCECPGGCEYSDAGPWQDATWVREPKWAKKGQTTGGAGQPQPTPTSAAPQAGGTAPAPQPGAAPVHDEGAGRLDTHAHA